jgi:hypothetical protein
VVTADQRPVPRDRQCRKVITDALSARIAV